MRVLSHLQTQGHVVSRRWLCRLLDVPRSTFYYRDHPRRESEQLDEVAAERIHQIIEEHPAFGIRSVWAWMRFVEGVPINRKKVERIMQRKGWTLRRRRVGKRPRVEVTRSVAERPNQRWATDLAMVHCGKDGWCSIVPVIDCCTREVLGWELDRTARAKTAERALESALLARFGWLGGAPEGLTLRHDNGLVFGSRLYRRTVTEHRLRQEYITPYTPEENGLCERFIRTLKEQCTLLHSFTSLDHARATIGAWIEHYNTRRPHQALDYQTPAQRHLSLCQATA
jgi:putative transposase